VRKLLLLLMVAAAVVASVAGSATAVPAGSVRVVSSKNWRGLTYVLGLGSCDLFGAADPASVVFRDVNLTDHLNVTFTDFEGGPLQIYNSVATLHGVINSADGRYAVAGVFAEKDVRDPGGNAFIGTSGYATIVGPRGVVTGAATFRDLGGPPEFDLIFTGVTACVLKKRVHR